MIQIQNQVSLFDDYGIIKKEYIEGSNKELMDESWEYVMSLLEPSMLWKLGVYTTKVNHLENNERGMFIERFFCEQLNGENLDDVTANKLRLKGIQTKHDFTLPNGLKINGKTTCVEKNLYNRIGHINSSKSIKIFDTSRNKYITDQTISLRRQLDSIGWDVTILFYGYEKSTNRYSLHLTSLREMSETLLGDTSKENIMRLFSYTKGGSHYFIDRANIYYSAKKNGREFYSGGVDKEMVNEYIDRKTIKSKDKIFNVIS